MTNETILTNWVESNCDNLISSLLQVKWNRKGRKEKIDRRIRQIVRLKNSIRDMI